jgi:dCTP deaminase
VTAGEDAGVLANHEIRRLALEHGMIEPFADHLVRDGVISYGLESAGYDCRLGDGFLIFTDTSPAIVDPKRMEERAFVRQNGPEVIVPPNSFVLATTLEYLRMPTGVLGILLGKSTSARCGLVVNATPPEPGWCGTITLEISNATALSAVSKPGKALRRSSSSGSPRTSRSPTPTGGIYQGQRGVTLPRAHAHVHGK